MLWRPRKAVKKLLYLQDTDKRNTCTNRGGEQKIGIFPRKKTKEHRFFGENVCFGRILLSPFLLSCCTFMEFVWGGGRKTAAGAFFGVLKTETKKMKPKKKGMQRKSTFDDFFKAFADTYN